MCIRDRGIAPLHCVGTGKAILAADYSNLRDQLGKTLTRYTDKTITTLKMLDADIKATLLRGYAYDTGEFRERIVSLGAAITLPGGEPVGALGISLPDINMPEGGEAQYGTLVAKAAQSISAGLGQN